jgi:hypothetical protein
MNVKRLAITNKIVHYSIDTEDTVLTEDFPTLVFFIKLVPIGP